MDIAPRTILSLGWEQLAERAPWPGIDVAHYRTGSHEGEYEMKSSLCISLINCPADQYSFKNRWGRWEEFSLFRNTLSYIPCGYGEQVRWNGPVDAINVLVDTSWLQAPDGGGASQLRLLDVPRYAINDKVLTALVSDIYKDNQLGAPYGLTYSEHLVLSVLYRLNGVLLLQQGRALSKDASIVNRAMDYIHANLSEQLSMADVAKAIGFESSLFALVRLFRRHTGQSPHRYILEARLQLAKDLLRDGKASVTHAAMSSGFTNLSHFSTAFKTRWGVPPSRVVQTETSRSKSVVFL